MICSSVKLAVRRCFIPGRARRCFMVIVAVSLTSLWMLTMQVIQVRPQTNLPDVQSRGLPDASISRTKSPKTSGHRLANEAHGGSPMDSPPEFEEEGTKLHQRLLKGEPVYQMAERHIKDTEGLVLVFLEASDSGRSLVNILLSHRFNVKVALVHDSVWPSFTHDEKGIFSVIIFESLRSYGHLSSVKTKVLQEYCRAFNVGIIIFTQPEMTSDFAQVRNFPLYIEQHVRLKNPIVNQSSNVPRIIRSNLRFFGNLPGDQWTTFRTNHSTYVPVMEAHLAVPPQVVTNPEERARLSNKICIVYDRGWMDGIKRIFFGYSSNHFLHMMLLLDSIAHLTSGKLQTDLDRYFLIDIDDIFVGKTGIRLKVSDVENMIKVQGELQELVKGFRFNLGFSGKYYQHGDEEENAGDRKLLEEAKHFWWFPHMWDHMQPHLIKTKAKLKDLMLQNKQFAVDHNIPMMKGYSVAPHHSGVYPVHEDLYDVWKEVWGIDATSTEEYPHLRPSHRRRGFIHKDIMVLPRQTCSLFTKTNFFSEYNGGKTALDANIQGGELFATIVSNPVNIFMTHMSNYGSDRLATYMFKHAFQFVHTYTNLRLQTLPPVPTAKKYFELYPQEKQPLWGNPCDDHRLMEVWAENKDCSRLPNSLILGPQKTGI
ncbi:bifunctional heparan sulfate N-deacetylase/N-sulfotransferase 2-like [Lytechinus pictus]|uniref:bifunctional heparan sulfate N-deacetylase/N-sulfotransferase 2-like n=1 Tax=Lytechinus pictus TaxID=7653 RepID=UPI0030B9D72F